MKAQAPADLREDPGRHATHPKELEPGLLLALSPGNAYFSANQRFLTEGIPVVGSGPSSSLCDLTARRNIDLHRWISKSLYERDHQIHCFRSHLQQFRGEQRSLDQFRPRYIQRKDLRSHTDPIRDTRLG